MNAEGGWSILNLTRGEKTSDKWGEGNKQIPYFIRDDIHQEKQKDDGRRGWVRAESQQTAIAILHHGDSGTDGTFFILIERLEIFSIGGNFPCVLGFLQGFPTIPQICGVCET